MKAEVKERLDHKYTLKLAVIYSFNVYPPTRPAAICHIPDIRISSRTAPSWPSSEWLWRVEVGGNPPEDAAEGASDWAPTVWEAAA